MNSEGKIIFLLWNFKKIRSVRVYYKDGSRRRRHRNEAGMDQKYWFILKKKKKKKKGTKGWTKIIVSFWD